MVGQRGARAIIIIFEYVTIKEKGMDPINICNIVHPVDDFWRKNIIRSIDDRFAAAFGAAV